MPQITWPDGRTVTPNLHHLCCILKWATFYLFISTKCLTLARCNVWKVFFKYKSSRPTYINVENNRIMFPNNNKCGLNFSLSVYIFRFEWDKLLENVHCLIISVTKTDKQEAYILRWAFDVSVCPEVRWLHCNDAPILQSSSKLLLSLSLKINMKLRFHREI